MRIGFVPNYVLTADGTTFTVTERDAALTRGAFSNYSLFCSPATFSLGAKVGGLLWSGELSGTRQRLGNTVLDGANYYRSSGTIRYAWDNDGGDWLDAGGVSQGTNYETQTGSVTGAIATWNVSQLVTMLLAENTGFILHNISPDSNNINQKCFSADDATPPTLTIHTTIGGPFTLTPTINTSTAIGATVATIPDGGNPYLSFPAFLKFNLSGVTGTVTSATLTVKWANQWGAVIACSYLDMPVLITDPATQLGGAIAGPSGDVAVDTDLDGTVLFYAPATSPTVILDNWTSVSQIYAANGTDVAIDPVFRTDGGWEQFGVTGLRFSSQSPDYNFDNSSILSYRAYIEQLGGNPNFVSATPRSELYARFTVKVDIDVKDGMTDIGVKMPGFEGAGFSYRTEHAAISAANPDVYRFYVGNYDAANPFNTPGRAGETLTSVCLRAGQIYSIEQRVKQNTVYNTLANGNLLGTVSGSPTTTSLPTSLISFVGGGVGTVTANQFQHCTLQFDAATPTVTLRGVSTVVTSHTSGATPTFTVDPLAHTPAVNDTFALGGYDGPIYNTESDGALEIWVDGVPVFSDTARVLNNVGGGTALGARGTIIQFWELFFHGGSELPSQAIHYEIGPTVVDDSYIGPMKRLASTSWPAWRRGLLVETPYSIPGTSMLTAGIANTIDLWSGLACVGTKLVGAANGGHTDTNNNGVFSIDLNVDSPAWGTLLATSAVAPAFPSSAQYYSDGRPCSRHTYYGVVGFESTNRVMMMYCGSRWSDSDSNGTVDGFNLTTNLYDAAGTYATATWSQGSANASCCKNPATDDVYVVHGTNFQKYTRATNSWSSITTSIGAFFDAGNVGTLVDATRNRWVSVYPNDAKCVDLTSFVYTSHVYTGLPTQADNAGAGASACHDTTNDKYWNITQNGRVYRIDPVTWVVEHMFDVTNPLIAFPNGNGGPYAKFHYIASLGGIAYYPRHSASMIFIPTE